MFSILLEIDNNPSYFYNLKDNGKLYGQMISPFVTTVKGGIKMYNIIQKAKPLLVKQ